MSRLPLTIALGDSDRVRPLVDGRVTIEGCDANILTMPVEEIFHRALHYREFDVAEIGMSPYIVATASARRSYVAIPAFLSRTFRHSAIYVRTDRGIAAASDLRRRRIGVPEYQQSAGLWIRGWLQDEFGIGCEEMHWVQAGLQQSGRRDTYPLALPPNFPLETAPPGATLSAMLATGEVDAIFSARAPDCVLDGAPNVGRLFADYRSVEQAYFQRWGHFPIMHAAGVRDDVLAAHPWLPVSLMKAFTAAKHLADDDLREVVALKIGLPWTLAEVEATERVMGRDFWSYGIEANRATLATMVRYSYEQHLSPRQVTVDELFAPGTAEPTLV